MQHVIHVAVLASSIVAAHLASMLCLWGYLNRPDAPLCRRGAADWATGLITLTWASYLKPRPLICSCHMSSKHSINSHCTIS